MMLSLADNPKSIRSVLFQLAAASSLLFNFFPFLAHLDLRSSRGNLRSSALFRTSCGVGTRTQKIHEKGEISRKNFVTFEM